MNWRKAGGSGETAWPPLSLRLATARYATVYTKPWTIRVNQSLALDTEMMEFVCLENEKDVRHLVGK